MEWIVEVVLSCDADTLMHYAFLRALGIDAPKPKPRRGAIVQVDAYEGTYDPGGQFEECFRNDRGVPL